MDTHLGVSLPIKNGKYLVWDISGHLKFVFHKTGGNNAVAAGIFFDTLAEGSNPAISNQGGASNLTAYTAELYGNLGATGGAPTEVQVYWGTNDPGSNTVGWLSGGSSNLGNRVVGTVHATATGLAPETAYFYRYYATNTSG